MAAAIHVEFASDVADLTCPECSTDSVREAVLVNVHGLVLSRGQSCTHCGHLRHRASRRRRADVHSGVFALTEDGVSQPT
jgi:uncharacterized Zn finger protein